MLLVGSWRMSPDAWEFDAESLSLGSGASVDVLARLMRHRGHVVTREQLLREA
jgi:DNA-binding response OmpR family regulator